LDASFLPSLENRTLDIDPDIPGFRYQWEECIKRILGICTKREIKRETYDLRDVEVRKKLINMNFVASVREKS
jgi:hypothetical protein